MWNVFNLSNNGRFQEMLLYFNFISKLSKLTVYPEKHFNSLNFLKLWTLDSQVVDVLSRVEWQLGDIYRQHLRDNCLCETFVVLDLLGGQRGDKVCIIWSKHNVSRSHVSRRQNDPRS
ncbi:hypothetical protein BIW11_05835 [Tropilaelaps mercedesae]|uniref:Uncharacterized protein n=1 Tax=Tropilaelaps mercedesae TaxID=418985 RepID=A0A1V9Y0P5_9ACAR|nr:hypothetical protein BIW11_05835 [Tropilaelaps mercedesae]